MQKTFKVRTSLFLIILAASFLGLCGNLHHQREASSVMSAQECLTCHDGSFGKQVHLCVGPQCLLQGNHSVFSPYPPSRRQEDYATRAEIEQAGSILENGTITCLSCHDLTKPAPHLIRPGDDLCHVCHLGQ